MAVVTLVSASGSPGVSTTALGLAMSWTRPVVLVEADPTGASTYLAGYFRGSLGHTKGLIDLAMSLRQDRLAEDLPDALLEVPGTPVRLLNGPRSHPQSQSLATLWQPLADVLVDLEATGQDVVVDAGRLGLMYSPEPLMAASDLVLMVTRSTLPALSGARAWAPSLSDALATGDQGLGLGALVVGPGRPYAAGEIAKVLQMPVVCSVPWEPEPADVLSTGAEAPRKFERSPLVKAYRAAVGAVQGAVVARRRDLARTGGDA